ncbi:MAG: hypothetical protein K1X51_05160 [Rhodospirillaceae bacterium]|nr:hypothetical protein [Rhodospirillaceae bacterium]
MNDTEKEDPLMLRADILVATAKGMAKPAREAALAKYPFLAQFIATPEDETWWQIVFTIAAVYIAAARLENLGVGRARETKLMGRVTEHLLELNANALAAFDDCKEFFGRSFEALTAKGHNPRFVTSDSIGAWAAWNMMDRGPETEDEAQCVRGLGVAITHAFFGWWDEGKPVISS